jgi:hypothetical protein
MALTSSLMGVGMPSQQASLLGFGETASGLVGAGSSSSDALQLTAGVNIFATVANGSGAKLPSGPLVGMVAVINGGANALLVYPGETGGQINNATATTGSYSVANGKTAVFIRAGLRWIATLST